MDWTSQVLKAAPETALFTALVLGHALGRLKFGSFSLGGVAGPLIVALVIGQLTGVVMPDALKAVCFALFIYAVGFKSGPEFFGGLNRSSLKLMLSSVVQCQTPRRLPVQLQAPRVAHTNFAAGGSSPGRCGGFARCHLWRPDGRSRAECRERRDRQHNRRAGFHCDVCDLECAPCAVGAVDRRLHAKLHDLAARYRCQ
jgi:Predicted Permease Membrane Region